LKAVKIDTGYISGTVMGKPGKEVYVFRGVPFAAPPVGNLRWKPPQPVVPWSDTRECTTYSIQAAHTPQMARGPIQEMSEDCLYLNLMTPTLKPNAKLPVMVWMHGGGLLEGNGNRAAYNGLGLPEHGVVQVNLNMRIGVLGLLGHPLLSQESPYHVSGNYLFLDMIAGLKWVQKNIAAFGGNPENVTIFGQSGGGTKVTGLLCSPLAKGLFHRAVIQSGAGLVGLPLKDIESFGDKLFTILGVDKQKDPLAAARALPWKDILDANVILSKDTSVPPVDKVAIDGWFMSDTPLNIFQTGKQNRVPLLAGSTMGELHVWPHNTRKHIPYYVSLLTSINQVGGKGYAYIFDHVPAGWQKEGCITCHTMELPYLFGSLKDKNAWEEIFNVATNDKAGAKTQNPGCTDIDDKISDMISTIWATFAKTGNPSVKGIVDWPTYDPISDRYVYFIDHPEIKSGFSKIA
jgi:para-nitrobenzyl esterase